MEKILEFMKGTTAKRFYWNTANGFIGLLIIYISGESFAYAPLVIAALNSLTKWINKEYLS